MAFESFWKLTNTQSGAADTSDDFGGMDAPKLKFLFTVKFDFRTGFSSDTGADDLSSMIFGMKTGTRPNININYQDTNYYNFRTKVATRTEYTPVSLTFYDDVKNRAHDIFQGYLNSVSPVSNVTKAQAAVLDTLGQSDSASLGRLEVNRHGILSNIRVTHHYNENYTGGNARKVHYDYLNPKVTNMALDELDMTISEASTLTMSFSYDSVNIVKE